MNKSRLQIYKPGIGEITEKKSRFLGECTPVFNEKEAIEYVASVKKRYYDAKHHCFAYVLADENNARCADDGEPQGTAGLPILDVILGECLTNTLIVVTRYFGGVLLGTGGLTRAYREAAKAAVSNAELIEKHRGYKLDITHSYDLNGKLENLIRNTQGIYGVDIIYGENVTRSIVVPEGSEDSLKKDVINITCDSSCINTGELSDYGIVDNRVVWL